MSRAHAPVRPSTLALYAAAALALSLGAASCLTSAGDEGFPSDSGGNNDTTGGDNNDTTGGDCPTVNHASGSRSGGECAYTCDGGFGDADDDLFRADGGNGCECEVAGDEVCNEEDDDCDGDVDEEATDGATWHADVDGDTYGDPDNTRVACVRPANFVSDDTDCDDTDERINTDAEETCDGADNDCDDQTDEAGASDPDTFYLDEDGDGVGVDTDTTEACAAPDGYAAEAGDCDDNDADATPGKDEICEDGVDNDCDGDADFRDADAGCEPPGEACEDALEIGDPGSHQGDLGDFTDDVQLEGCVGAGPDQVFAVDLPAGEISTLHVGTFTANAEMRVALVDDCGGAMIACLSPGIQDVEGLLGGRYYLVAKVPDDGTSATFSMSVATSDAFGRCTGGDDDGDGATFCDGDCDNSDPDLAPGLDDLCGDGINNDCDGQVDEGGFACAADADGLCAFGRQVCDGGEGTCMPAFAPGDLTEVPGNDLDEDCDGTAAEGAFSPACTDAVMAIPG